MTDSTGKKIALKLNGPQVHAVSEANLWALDKEFEVGGYQGKVTSVGAVSVNSELLPFPDLRPDRSIDSGYEFTIQSMDPDLKWNVGISMDQAEGYADVSFVDCIGYIPGEASPAVTHTVSCGGLPKQTRQGTIYEVSVLMDGTWEIDWVLPGQ